MKARSKWSLRIVILALGITVPYVSDEYTTQLLIVIFTFTIVAVAWNLLVTTGQISLGHAAFFGIGAYAAALSFIKLNLPLFGALAVGAIASVVLAFILGFICLRMRGVYLAITTLVFAEALRSLAIMVPKVTNGANGLSLPILFRGDTLLSYYLVLFLLVASVIVTIIVKASPLGYAFFALRENEHAANMLGINPVKYKLIAFTISALITGLAGGFYAFNIGYIDPHGVFSAQISIKSQVLPLVGGLYTIAGPVVGGIVTGFATELLRAFTDEGSELIYGALLIFCVILYPKGIMGFVSVQSERLFKHGLVTSGKINGKSGGDEKCSR